MLLLDKYMWVITLAGGQGVWTLINKYNLEFAFGNQVWGSEFFSVSLSDDQVFVLIFHKWLQIASVIGRHVTVWSHLSAIFSFSYQFRFNNSLGSTVWSSRIETKNVWVQASLALLKKSRNGTEVFKTFKKNLKELEKTQKRE